MKNLQSKIQPYFYGLNEFRAVAALLVYFHHIERYKSKEGYYSLYDEKYFHIFISEIGHNAVFAFFVLSGFLITYLLLVEKKQNGAIDIKAFYVRRILRIWPLYFLIVFIGFVVVPLLHQTGFFNNQLFYPMLIDKLNYLSIVFFLLFLSNFALIYFDPVVGAAHSSSVSVEEQFYLFWPFIVKYSNNTKRLFVIILIILIMKLNVNNFLPSSMHVFVEKFSIEYMCIGGLLAILLFSNNAFKKTFKSKLIFTIVVLGLLVELFFFNQEIIIAILIAFLIGFIITFKIQSDSLNFLGKISYGIYMFHPLMMYLFFPLAKKIDNVYLFNVIFYCLTLGFTLVIAKYSYKYIELPVLQLKTKYIGKINE
jgi:peptidoglycan/LPS O-acetylase OafA/YrhL